MVVHRRKKITKRRGTRTYGCGSHKKKRGGGSRGGRGKAGRKKHKKSWVIRYQPDYFGKKGFKITPKAQKETKAITLRDIDVLALKLNKTEINLSELGYDKVLSTGELTQPLTIMAKKFVEKAKQKIESAGGKAIENV
ncbi:MAG: 50S ribosomal protein L15 [Candidatus Aenigmarchaeota archaeon]|nr:50S ribosomal protein L15 [Candidatus Aenigmarchaeota archaeon]